jgi:hypothetical protein
MELTAWLEMLSRTETWDKCFQQGVAKTSIATVTVRSQAKLFACINTSNYIVSDGRMINEEEWKESVVAWFKVLSQHLPGGSDANHEKPQSEWPVSGCKIRPELWSEPSDPHLVGTEP